MAATSINESQCIEQRGNLQRGVDCWLLAGRDVHCGAGLLLEVVTKTEWDDRDRETVVETTWLPVRAEIAWAEDVGRLPYRACVYGGRVLVLHIAALGARSSTRVVATGSMRLAWPSKRRA